MVIKTKGSYIDAKKYLYLGEFRTSSQQLQVVAAAAPNQPQLDVVTAKPRHVLRKTHEVGGVYQGMHTSRKRNIRNRNVSREVTYIELQPEINQHLAGSPDSGIPPKALHMV